eukprot:4961315-Pyramimonas_sp.AAC.1
MRRPAGDGSEEADSDSDDGMRDAPASEPQSLDAAAAATAVFGGDALGAAGSPFAPGAAPATLA